MKKNYKKFFDRIFLKFLIVGILNTVVGAGIMFFCYNVLQLSYWLSSGLNYLIGSLLSYFLNKYFTFQKQGQNVVMVIRFAVTILCCYVLAYGFARLTVQWILKATPLAIRDNVSLLVGMCVFVVLNYLGQRYWAFRTQK